MTAVVFVIVLLTKFLAGAWIAILAMCVFFAIMKAIRRHYDNVSRELAADDEDKILPTKVHAVVLVSKLHKPTLRALAYAKATRPNVLEAVYVASDDATTKALVEEWDDRNLGVPLKVLYSPYREIVRPIVEYAVQIRKANPRGVVAVYIPEYVVGRWWEQLLHNQTALRLKGRLLFTPGRHGDLGALPAPVLADRPGPRQARARPGQGRRPAARHRAVGRPGAPAQAGPTDDRPPRPTPPVSARRVRARAPRGSSHVGERFEAEVGPVAHGGHCVARHDGPGRVRPARAAGGAGRRVGHRGLRRRPVLARRRRRGAGRLTRPRRRALPLRRARAVRGLRLPARHTGRAARAEGGGGARAAVAPGRPDVDVTVEEVRADAAVAHADAVRRAAGRGSRAARAPLRRGGRDRRLPDRRRRCPAA